MQNPKMDRFIEKAKDGDSFDVIIVGGGITGAALSYEVASRGYSVALVEKGDFGGATSSATGKLIHGGLRYLKRFDIGLVREALRERRILSNIAPNHVYPFPMILPNPGLLERIGLFVYDLLSWDRNRTWDKSKRIPGHRLLSAKEIQEKNLGPIRKAIYFYDCIMPSPERLTLSFLKSALGQGAVVSNYSQAEEFIFEGNRVVGVEVKDKIHQRNVKLKAEVVVNASGPWSQELLRRTGKLDVFVPKKRSEGIYLITKKYFDTMILYVGEKGHFSFAPWRGRNMIGPTEKSYFGSVDDWKLTKESVLEFLEYINSSNLLPQKLTLGDVDFVYGGLRPLAETEDDKETYSASRKSELQDHSTEGILGLISAGGGKYTTSRDFAEKIFLSVRKQVGKKSLPNLSAKVFLKGCEIPNMETYLETAKKNYAGFAENTVEYLVRHYGTEFESVLELANSNAEWAQVLDEDGEISAQAIFAIRNEMARSLEDIFFRRTGLGTLGRPKDSVLEKIADLAAKELQWSPERKKQELERVKARLHLPLEEL